MKKVLKWNNLSTAVIAVALALASCSKSTDNPLSSSDSQNVNSESVADSYTSETSDMTNSVTSSITNTQYQIGRVDGGIVLTGLGDKDSRLKGAIVTITPTGTNKDNPSGTITIDFGASPGIVTDGITRIGKIIITYSGKKGVTKSTRAISYSGYSRNGVVFDNGMTFTITNVQDSTVFHHVLAGGLLTFPDNDKTTITRISDYYVTLSYSAKTLTLSATPGITGHSASGTTRGGKPYTMDITTALVYKAECVATKVFIPVSGAKSITAGALTYTINYGEGTCDNTITITVGGKSVTITVSGDGN